MLQNFWKASKLREEKKNLQILNARFNALVETGDGISTGTHWAGDSEENAGVDA